MLCKDIIKILEKQSPESYALEWDNVGLLIGDCNKEIRTIYIALDATDEVIRQAKEHKADLLLTHHPLIFKGLKKINTDDFIGRRIITLIQSDIAYYAMHTNFDVLGMAELSAQKLNLTETKVLSVTCVRDLKAEQAEGIGGLGKLSESVSLKDYAKNEQEEGIGRVGKLSESVSLKDYAKNEQEEGIGRVGKLSEQMSLKDCVGQVKAAFSLAQVQVYGELTQKVHTLAISPGSGKSAIEAALQAKADVLVTGDVDHHMGIDAIAQGLAVIDGGHYGVEKIFIPYMKQFLEEQTKGEGITVFGQAFEEPFVYC
ncbi:GTP cyclohydrolase 1 type 2 [Clostridia bacterium]|nr:GTP cyclohydrolase 1 type 2 [Clostridia bacterium]